MEITVARVWSLSYNRNWPIVPLCVCIFFWVTSSQTITLLHSVRDLNPWNLSGYITFFSLCSEGQNWARKSEGKNEKCRIFTVHSAKLKNNNSPSYDRGGLKYLLVSKYITFEGIPSRGSDWETKVKCYNIPRYLWASACAWCCVFLVGATSLLPNFSYSMEIF